MKQSEAEFAGNSGQNTVLSHAQWTELALQHQREVSRLTDAYVSGKSHQQQNPVMDFMFTYYKFRPAKLRQWTPGAFVLLEGAGERDGFDPRYFAFSAEGAFLDFNRFPARKARGLNWIINLLHLTESRQPNLGCCGMHEWAMVYEAVEVRHQSFPLRLSRPEIRDFVERHPVNCSHFDAFRFFTPAARPLNTRQLSRESMHEHEQPGCLHTNMDLYKWSYKLTPWVPSAITLAAFKLACEARELDMQAGPYDLRSIGYEPVCIETEEGRRTYKKRQAEIFEKAKPVRQALLACLNRLSREMSTVTNDAAEKVLHA